MEQAQKLAWEDVFEDARASSPPPQDSRKSLADRDNVLRLALTPKAQAADPGAKGAQPKRDMTAALDLVVRASDALTASEVRTKELEARIRELAHRATEELNAADGRIKAAEARAQAAEARAQEMDEWLGRLHDVIIEQFASRHRSASAK
jgi:hypothetical protein